MFNSVGGFTGFVDELYSGDTDVLEITNVNDIVVELSSESKIYEHNLCFSIVWHDENGKVYRLDTCRTKMINGDADAYDQVAFINKLSNIKVGMMQQTSLLRGYYQIQGQYILDFVVHLSNWGSNSYTLMYNTIG